MNFVLKIMSYENQPGPSWPGIKVLDNTSDTWIVKVPVGSNCHAVSDDGCTHCCPSCAVVDGEERMLNVGGSMTMSAPKGNPRYKWVEIWYDDWETLAVKVRPC